MAGFYSVDRDVGLVVDHCAFVAFVKNGNISIVSKGSHIEEHVG